MILELIATVAAGVGGAGIAMAARKITRDRLPKWIIPIAAGGAMLATTISSEYAWYANTSANLPESMIVAQTVENSSLLRPWTRAWPFIDRFVVVESRSLRTNPAHPELRIAEAFFFGRWQPVNRIDVVADCTGLRRAPVNDAVQIAEDGAITGANWVAVAADDALLTTICQRM